MPAEPDKHESSEPVRAPAGPLPVAPNCWMVGHRNPNTLLQCNTYVRKFEGRGSPRNVCIDPGSQFDFSVIEGNIAELVGGLSEIHTFTVNHQDPDVVGNAPYFCDANPNVDMFATEETWRLLQHMLFKPGRVRLTNQARGGLAAVTPHDHLRLVPTPFCHFRGAMAFYDPEIRTLYSGDLFGGFNRVAAVHLMATEEDWQGIAQFQQIYMPTREVLRHAVREILSLHPAVEVIAPQHGHVITGDLVPLFLEQMQDLLVGHDLMAGQWDQENLAAYSEVIRRLIDRAELSLGREEVWRRVADTSVGDELARHGSFRRYDFTLEHEGYAAVIKVFARLVKGERLEFVIAMRAVVLGACSEQGLPIPSVGAGLEESAEGSGSPGET